MRTQASLAWRTTCPHTVVTRCFSQLKPIGAIWFSYHTSILHCAFQLYSPSLELPRISPSSNIIQCRGIAWGNTIAPNDEVIDMGNKQSSQESTNSTMPSPMSYQDLASVWANVNRHGIITGIMHPGAWRRTKTCTRCAQLASFTRVWRGCHISRKCCRSRI